MADDRNWRDREDNSQDRGYRNDYRSDRAGSGQQNQFSDDNLDDDRTGGSGQMGEARRHEYDRTEYDRGSGGRDDTRQRPRIVRSNDDRNDRDRGNYGPRAMTGRDDARAGYSRDNAYGPSRYSDGSGGEFGSFNSQDYGGRDFQSNNRRTYAGADMNYSAGGYGSSYNNRSRGFDRGYAPEDRNRSGRGHDRDDRGFFDRAGDEVASWFGDDDAARRRQIDERRDGGNRDEDHRGRGPSGYTRPDQRILEDACDALTHDRRVDASNIQVTVDDGEVTLDGTVTDRQAKRQAEDTAHDVSGVKHVQNNLRIQERGRGSSDDTAETNAGTSVSRASATAESNDTT